MTSAKLEGTLTLDGLIEGRLSTDPTVVDKLTKWVAFARSLGLGFDLDISGNSFSVLAKANALQSTKIGESPERIIAQILQQLLDIFPQGSRQGIFSTLRSTEIRKGEEVQALYPVGPDGTIQSQTRHQATKTTSTVTALSARQQVVFGALGLLGALALFAVLSLFVDFRSLIHHVVDTARPLDPAEIRIDASVYKSFFSVEVIRVTPTSQYMILRVKREDGYPRSEDALRQLWSDHKDKDLVSRLTVEALARGYVRCELFDTENNFVTFHMLRVQELRSTDTVELFVPVPDKVRIGKLLLTY